MKFNLSINNWNLVSEVGLPDDGAWCFLIFGSSKNGYDWSIGSYSQEVKRFYANMGMGGLVLDEKDVVAWALWDEVYFTSDQ